MVDGAAVRVSLVCFSRRDGDIQCRLDGQLVKEVYADLTARRDNTTADITAARRLSANPGTAFLGVCRNGPFDVPGDRARDWLRLPANPHGRNNADVLKPWVNGMDLTRRSAGRWIIDFGFMADSDAALYEAPFAHVVEHVRPVRRGNRVQQLRKLWWRHQRPRPEMWAAVDGLSRYIATPTVAKHRLFVWCDARICPDHQLIVIARDDDTTFGILHSSFHELWSLRLCTWLGKGNDPRYTPSTTFETFPFPAGLTPNVPASGYAAEPRAGAVAEASRRLVELRDRWLNPPEWVEWVDEPVPRISTASGSPRRGRRESAQEAHADEPLQRPPPVARGRARCSRCFCRSCLRVARRHHRRRGPPRVAGSQRRPPSRGKAVRHDRHPRAHEKRGVMKQSQIFWTWVGRVGGVVGLIGGGLAIYAFVGGRLLAFIIWPLAVSAVLISRMRRADRGLERMERIEAKVDRLLAHFDVDPHLGDRDGAGPGPAGPGLPEGVDEVP